MRSIIINLMNTILNKLIFTEFTFNVDVKLKRNKHYYYFYYFVNNLLTIMDFFPCKSVEVNTLKTLNHEVTAIKNIKTNDVKKDIELVLYIIGDFIRSLKSYKIKPTMIKIYFYNKDFSEIIYNDYFAYYPMSNMVKKKYAIKICRLMGITKININNQIIKIKNDTNYKPFIYFNNKYSKQERINITYNFINVLRFKVFKILD